MIKREHCLIFGFVLCSLIIGWQLLEIQQTQKEEEEAFQSKQFGELQNLLKQEKDNIDTLLKKNEEISRNFERILQQNEDLKTSLAEKEKSSEIQLKTIEELTKTVETLKNSLQKIDNGGATAIKKIEELTDNVETLRGRIPKRKSFYEIALAAPTDKVMTHHYEDAFERFLSPLRDKKVKLFEIGLGCGMPYGPGKSVLVWKEYFQDSEVFVLDYNAPCAAEWRDNQTQPATLFIGDAGNVTELYHIIDKVGRFDVIIDDGNHEPKYHIISMVTLFPYLNPGGVYFVEDLQAQYWPWWAGTTLKHPNSTIEFFKNLIDGLNRNEAIEGVKVGVVYEISYYIHSIHCYTEICVLERNNNQTLPARKTQQQVETVVVKPDPGITWRRMMALRTKNNRDWALANNRTDFYEKSVELLAKYEEEIAHLEKYCLI